MNRIFEEFLLYKSANDGCADRTIAAFVQAYTFGRVLAGFDSKLSKDDDAQWVALIDDAVEHILFN